MIAPRSWELWEGEAGFTLEHGTVAVAVFSNSNKKTTGIGTRLSSEENGCFQKHVGSGLKAEKPHLG